MAGTVALLSLIFSYVKGILEIAMYALVCIACIKYIKTK